jgi:hypothetical protein
MHRRTLRSERTSGLVESAVEALEQLAACASPIDTVIAADSARPAVERDLLTLIRRDEHRWRARHPEHDGAGIGRPTPMAP